MLTMPACQRIGAPGVAADEQAGPEHDHGLRIGGELGRRGLPAFGIAAVVLGVELQRVAEQLAADVLEGDFDAALLVQTERGVGTGQHPIGADLDRRALGDADHAEIVGHGTDRGGRGGMRHGQQRDRCRYLDQSKAELFEDLLNSPSCLLQA